MMEDSLWKVNYGREVMAKYGGLFMEDNLQRTIMEVKLWRTIYRGQFYRGQFIEDNYGS